jgi:hypothetical protein
LGGSPSASSDILNNDLDGLQRLIDPSTEAPILRFRNFDELKLFIFCSVID